MIDVKHAEYSYGLGKKTLTNINHRFASGSITAILGPNGCGKTTLLKLMVRLLAAKGNDISIDGKSVGSFNPKEFARKVAYVPQETNYPEATTVRDFVAYGRNPYTGMFGLLSTKNWRLVDQAIAQCGITHLANRELSSLSGGQRQLAALALTVAQGSDVILLDEPNSFLDVNYVAMVMELLVKLKEQGNKTIILTIHDINQAAKYADEIVLMKQGKIVHAAKTDEAVNKKYLQEVFEIDAEITQINGRPHVIDYERLLEKAEAAHEGQIKRKKRETTEKPMKNRFWAGLTNKRNSAEKGDV